MQLRKLSKRNVLLALLALGAYMLIGELLDSSRDFADNKEKIELIEESIRSPANQEPCRIPDLPLNSSEIMAFYKNEDPIECEPEDFDWVKCEGSICSVKQSVIKKRGQILCDFTDLLRASDFKVKNGQTTRNVLEYHLVESDFVRVRCVAPDKYKWFGTVYGIRDGVAPARPRWSATVGAGEERREFNVLMYGFDSLSRLAFMRKLPRSHAYLTQELGGLVLEGYNIVGDGTPQALIPLLTGFTELELPETRKRKKNSAFVNVYPMIWTEYEHYGYVTAFNEDVPNIGTFSYRLNGFDAQPTDHYLRTFYLAIDPDLKMHRRLCVGSQPRHQVMLDYTRQFMQSYSDRPRFVFSFHGELSHDSINLIGVADDDVVDWMRQLKGAGVLEDTILILMSDHGNRFADVRNTLQGKQEERLPFFSFVFPDSFKQAYPDQYRNFKANLKRLVTPFDIHATLEDILRLRSPNTIQKPFPSRAISLFTPIPENRSCSDAYIEPHWCSCLSWHPVDPTSALVQRAAVAVVAEINALTAPSRRICLALTLHQLQWAAQLTPHATLVKFKTNKDADGFVADLSSDTRVTSQMFQVKLTTRPGDAIFEASVTHRLDDDSFRVRLSDVSRVNKYGDQARCIYDRQPELRKFCYCSADS